MRFRILLLLAVLIIPFVVAATVRADDLVEAYQSATTLQRGTLVRLNNKDSRQVTPVSRDKAQQFLGVTVAASDSTVTLDGGSADGVKTFVARTGRYDILVSNQNGDIKPDDYLAISSLDGVAMKAGADDQTVVGRALVVFGSGQTTAKTTVRLSDGSSRSVSLGRIQVDMSVSRNPIYNSSSSKVPSLGFLQRGANTVTNKAVSPVRLYLGLVIFCVVAIIAGILLYGGVRSAITAVGRNPLARKPITRSLLQTVVISLAVFIGGLIAVYLILKL